MKTITLNHTQGRGRNGWFQAREASVLAAPERIDVDVLSSRPVIPGPIRLELSPEDAATLARALLRSVADAQPDLLAQGEVQGGSFPGARAAVTALDAYVEALSGAAWLWPGELEAIRTEATTLRELLELSGRGWERL